jgi:hypothetical protein
MVVTTMESLVFFGGLVLLLFLGAGWFGADSRDGNDWIKHSRL